MANTMVVVGGGVAGVTCCQTLASTLSSSQESKVVLVAASGLLKGVANVVKLARFTDSFDVVEQEFDKISGPNTELVQGEALSIDVANKQLLLRDGRRVDYTKLCICTGASPKMISDHPRVLWLRDTESTVDLRRRLRSARRVMIVGNGGIALELVHEIRGCEVVWAVKDKHIGNAFFDEDASAFLAPALAHRLRPPPPNPSAPPPETPLADSHSDAPPGSDLAPAAAARARETAGGDAGHAGAWSVERASAREEGCGEEDAKTTLGSSLGPEWVSAAFDIAHNPRRLRSKEGFGVLTGALGEESAVLLETECEVTQVTSGDGSADGDWPLRVELSNGRVYGCDYVVSAIGVVPNSDWVSSITGEHTTPVLRDTDGGILVDDSLQTSIPDIFAAGDVCAVQMKVAPDAPDAENQGMGHEEDQELKPWHQMRLWTQARSLGAYAAACMLGYQDQVQSPYELFSHATQFMGYKVVLLGRYNAQGLPADAERVKFYIRTVPNEEYVKAVLLDGRLVGALLLGETDLEETFENLIMNGFDLSFIGDQLLNPDIDLEDYFD